MTCLILIDLQNDFMPGGALPVPNGDEVIAVANRVSRKFDHVIASKDWHPHDHLSFASQHQGHHPGDVIPLDGLEQILWPDHCVQNTKGADFHDALEAGCVNKVIQKGMSRILDSYSAFFDNAHRQSTGLMDYLSSTGIEEVHLLGLATDYCLKFSSLDAASLGLRTYVIQEGCRGIDLSAGDVKLAWDEMRKVGIEIVSEDSLG